MLNGLLIGARHCNRRDGVTGALICRQDVYLQLLEGPEPAVRDAFARIARDDRHVAVRIRVARPITERLFGEWEMLHDPARSWLWSRAEVAEGAIDRATPEEFAGVFEALAEKMKAGTVE